MTPSLRRPGEHLDPAPSRPPPGRPLLAPVPFAQAEEVRLPRRGGRTSGPPGPCWGLGAGSRATRSRCTRSCSSYSRTFAHEPVPVGQRLDQDEEPPRRPVVGDVLVALVASRRLRDQAVLLVPRGQPAADAPDLRGVVEDDVEAHRRPRRRRWPRTDRCRVTEKLRHLRLPAQLELPAASSSSSAPSRRPSGALSMLRQRLHRPENVAPLAPLG